MSQRNDPMFYDIEVQEIKTGKIGKSQVGCWWSGDASIKSLHAMCDCQLAGYFNAKPSVQDGRESWANAFAIGQNTYLKSNRCTHQSAQKFRPMRAHLPSGEVIELALKVAA